MIKGVTKSIIEISPKAPEFEKIIVILNSGCTPAEQTEIIRKAELITAKAPDFIKRERKIYRCKMLVCALSGAFFSAALLGILIMFV